MSEPLRKTARNKRTGETRDMISTDGGASWHFDDTSKADMALDQKIAAAGPEDTRNGVQPEEQGETPGAPDEPEPANIHETTLEPVKIEGDPNAGEPPAPKPTPSVWDSLGQAGNLAAERATLGWAPRYMGFGARLASDASDAGIPREYNRSGGGDEAQSIAATQRAENQQVRRDRPALAMVADTVGMAAPATLLAAAPEAAGFLTPTGFAGAAGMGGLAGGLYGATEGAAESTDPTLAGQLADASMRGNKGIAEGAGTAGLLHGGGAALGGLARGIRSAGDAARGMAAGGAELPLGEMAQYGRDVNAEGLPRVLPRSVHGYEKAASGAAGGVGAELGAARSAATESGKGVSYDALISHLEDMKTQLQKPPTTDTRDAQARVLTREIKRLNEARPIAQGVDPLAPGVNDIADLPPAVPNLRSPPPLKTRQATFASANHPGQTITADVPEIAAPNTQASASKTMRPGRRAPANAPEMASSVDTLREFPAPVEDVPLNRDAVMPPPMPPPQMSVSDLAARATELRGPTEGGFPTRGEARTMSTDTNSAAKQGKRDIAKQYSALEDLALNDPATRELKNRFARLAEIQNQAHVQAHPRGLHVPHSMSQLGLNAARNYGADVAAKGAYATANTLGAPAAAMRALAAPKMSGALAQTLQPGQVPPSPAPFRGITPRAAPASQVVEPSAQQDRAPDDTTGTRGQMLPDAAWSLYKQDPQAFGPYAENLLQARQRGEGQFAAELSRLESDPEFSRTVLPRLRQMTRRE